MFGSMLAFVFMLFVGFFMLIIISVGLDDTYTYDDIFIVYWFKTMFGQRPYSSVNSSSSSSSVAPSSSSETPMSCEKENPDMEMVCASVYDPVIGCNNKIYSNSCRASQFVNSFSPVSFAETYTKSYK